MGEEILSDDQLVAAYGKGNPADDHVVGCRHVAEIAYKAGYKHALEGAVIEGGYESVKRQGMREVVEWLGARGMLAGVNLRLDEWQAFLKEHGLK